MPKSTKRGKYTPEGSPPAGIHFHCYKCGEDMVTTDNEPNARPDVSEDQQQHYPGWYIPCTGCSMDVFVKMPGV